MTLEEKMRRKKLRRKPKKPIVPNRSINSTTQVLNKVADHLVGQVHGAVRDFAAKFNEEELLKTSHKILNKYINNVERKKPGDEDRILGMENPDNFEGDIILTPSQRKSYENKYVVVDQQKWLNGVVYVTVDENAGFAQDKIDLIKQAIQRIEDVSCVKFKWEKPTSGGHVKITTNFNGQTECSSSVGYQAREQNFVLTDGCWEVGTIMHELLHTLGFWHEQSRPDRDYHIKINEDNIMPNHENNFAKQEGQTQNAPYDTCSIMHYDSNAFSSNGEPTIVVKQDPGYPNTCPNLGNRKYLSNYDIRQINTLYQCKGYPQINDEERQPNVNKCTDKSNECHDMMLKGDCWNKRDWMMENCAHTCKLCTLLENDKNGGNKYKEKDDSKYDNKEKKKNYYNSNRFSYYDVDY